MFPDSTLHTLNVNTIDRLLSFFAGIQNRPIVGETWNQGDNMPHIWFVDSVNGSDGNDGRDPRTPLATLNEAFDKVTADRDDVIFVMPNHAETISAAAGIAFDVAGVSIIGLGKGQNRPTITFDTAATADLDIDADDIEIYNFRFVSDVASLAAPIDVNASGFKMVECDFYANDAADEAPLITIQTVVNADDLAFIRCGFWYLGALDSTAITTTSTRVISLVGNDRVKIIGCHFEGDFTVSAIDALTTACLGLEITDNHIVNIATEDIAGVVDLVADCRGVIARNHGFIGYATGLATVIDPSSCAMVENYFSNIVTEAGGLVGTAST